MMAMTRMLLMPVAATFICAAQGAQAQGEARTSSDIVLVGVVGPETEVNTVRASCFSRTFTFTITNHRAAPSVLTDARLEGRPVRRPESTAALQAFLAGVRNIHFAGTTCVSENEINIALSGLLRSSASGQDDDVLRLFRIRF